MQLPADISTRGATAGVFAQPRPTRDIGWSLIDLNLRPFLPFRAPVFATTMPALEPGCDMRRREFLTILGGASITHGWPIAGHAQLSSVRPLIGVLSPIAAPDAKPLITAFRSALRELGYVESRDMTIIVRY